MKTGVSKINVNLHFRQNHYYTLRSFEKFS